MLLSFLVSALVGLLPVVGLLAALVYFDSYKLVALRMVIVVILCGVVVAGASLLVNVYVLSNFDVDFTLFTRYVSPVIEELLKGIVIVVLIRTDRIGFLVDAAILGFAVGTGFAVVENLFYLHQIPDAGLGTWIVRGFGTAIMHGGATATFAMMTLAFQELAAWKGLKAFLPGYAVAVVLHSAFNHLFLSPKLSTLAIVIVVPLLLYAVFQKSEKAVGDWLGHGFDADTEMLGLINSGHFSESPIGQYLQTLKSTLRGPVVADVLCYLQLYTELALRAKGILMMRESGFEVPVDEETKAKFAEMRYLEGSIGKATLLAIQPMLHMSHKDLWQLYMLGK
ncbi:MAG TPA: PrsW family glutamic-type intramembrane protease [Casimicrobiaceae bacterium]|nr:PrsW family glutamic-type intramembrane protease [Casimicrobiaceae bacterium]